MRDISSIETLVVPDGVTVTLKARTVTVGGPRGTLRKNVGHIQMDIQLVSLHFIRFRDGLVRLGNRTDEWQFARRRDVHSGLPEDRTIQARRRCPAARDPANLAFPRPSQIFPSFSSSQTFRTSFYLAACLLRWPRPW